MSVYFKCHEQILESISLLNFLSARLHKTCMHPIRRKCSLYNPPWQVSAMPCWWGLTRPKQLFIVAWCLPGWYYIKLFNAGLWWEGKIRSDERTNKMSLHWFKPGGSNLVEGKNSHAMSTVPANRRWEPATVWDSLNLSQLFLSVVYWFWKSAKGYQARLGYHVRQVRPHTPPLHPHRLAEVHQQFRRLELGTLMKDHDDQHCWWS